MKHFHTIIILSLAALFSMPGCASFELTALRSSVPVQMNTQQSRPYTIVSHFTVTQEKPFLFLQRMFGAGYPNVENLLNAQLQLTPGDAIINLKISCGTDAADFFLPLGIGVLGAYAAPPLAVFALMPFWIDLKSYTLDGDIIAYTDTTHPQKDEPGTQPLVEKMQKKPVSIDPMTGMPEASASIPGASTENPAARVPVAAFDPVTGLPIK
jgi:hypothetical protein